MQIIERTVAKIGERLMVALDKDWCRQHGIKKGSKLGVAIVDNGFCVLPPGKEVKQNGTT